MSRRPPTFAQLAKEKTWSETAVSHSGQFAVRPGARNQAGHFFDPNGVRLHLQTEDASPGEAQRQVRAGALVIAETCGCGGWFGDCTPAWLTNDQLKEIRTGPPPRLTGRHDAPTWIEVWTNEDRAVVFAHEDIAWGSALE